MAGFLLVVRVHLLLSGGLECAKGSFLQQNGSWFVQDQSFSCYSGVPFSVPPAPLMEWHPGASLWSRAVVMHSLLWFITDAPLSRLLRQPPAVLLGAFKSEYAHVMFPPKPEPCLTQQPHIGSVPANNPNFHLPDFKVCSIHCNK